MVHRRTDADELRGPDRKRTSRKQSRVLVKLRKRRARSSASRNSFVRSTSAKQRISTFLNSLSHSRTFHRSAEQSGAQQHKVVIVASLFEKRSRGHLSQHRRHYRRLREAHRQVSQDAHPGRSALLRKVLFHSRRSWLSNSRHQRRQDRYTCLLGPVVPEAARLTALGGAQFLFYPTAIGWLARRRAVDELAQHSAWETIQRGHAIANGLYVVVVNRVGTKEN